VLKINSTVYVAGDVYILGCTNVGKSTLFNALLQSDYCKVQAVDLIQRATTSLWPGTTISLLKVTIY
jgi:ribosome biogenesis GTPase A